MGSRVSTTDERNQHNLKLEEVNIQIARLTAEKETLDLIKEIKIRQLNDMHLKISEKAKILRDLELKYQKAQELQKNNAEEQLKEKISHTRDLNRMKQETANQRKLLEEIEQEIRQAQELQRINVEEHQKWKITLEREINSINSEMVHKKKITEETIQKNKNIIDSQNRNMQAYVKMKALHEKRIDELNTEIANKAKILEEIESKIQKTEESYEKKIVFMKKEQNVKAHFEENSDDVHRWLMDKLKKKTITELILNNCPDHFKRSNNFNEVRFVPCFDSEYRSVKAQFMKSTQPHFNILSVSKIIYAPAMVDYLLKKKQFQLLHEKENVMEKLLFRGMNNVQEDLKNLNDSIYQFQSHWIKNPGFPSKYWAFTTISNHANRRCDLKSVKYMILATVMTCKCSGTKDSHNELCNYEVELKTDGKGRPKQTYFKFNRDEFYPTYLIKFTGNTLSRSKSPSFK